VASLACDTDSLLTLGAAGAEPEPAGADCRTVTSLSPTDAGVAGVFGEAGLGLSVSGAGEEGDRGFVTPAAAVDGRSFVAGGGVAPDDPGEAIGLVAEVADGRGAGDTVGIDRPDPEAEPLGPDEPDDFAESLAESDEPDEFVDESLPLRSALPFCSLPFLPSLSARDSGAFGSGFFRTTVSG